MKQIILTISIVILTVGIASAEIVEEIHYFQTADGVRLAFTRHHKRVPTPGKEPILMCHGFASNRYTWDLRPGHSVTEYLVNKGYDCWMLELRGHGHSYKPAANDPWGYDWSTEEYVIYDYPAAVDYLVSQTNSDIFLMGHSMGGMIAYAYLETHDNPRVKGAVTVGSPGKFGDTSFMVQFLTLFQQYIDVYPVIYAEWLTDALIPLSGYGWTPLGEVLWNYDNMTIPLIAALADDAVDNVSTKVVNDFLNWELEYDFLNHDGTFSYKDHLKDITEPILILAGRQDGLGEDNNVKYAFDHISSADKTYILFAQGPWSCDYGHLDLVCGVNAPHEVYPEIYKWLERRDGDNMIMTQFTSPRNNATITDTSVMIRGTAYDRDNAGIGKVELSFDGGLTFHRASGANQWEFTWSPPHDGEFTILARAWDNAGNCQQTPTTLNVSVDCSGPKIYMAGWGETNLRRGAMGKLTCMAYIPDTDVAEVQLYYQDVPLGLFLRDEGPPQDGLAGDSVFTYSSLVGLQPASGRFKLTLEAADASGNIGLWPALVVE